jgi:hypothetical protein
MMNPKEWSELVVALANALGDIARLHDGAQTPLEESVKALGRNDPAGRAHVMTTLAHRYAENSRAAKRLADEMLHVHAEGITKARIAYFHTREPETSKGRGEAR